MGQAGGDLEAKTSALLAEVSDLSVLGTNDTLGGVAQMIYGAFLEVFQETSTDLTQGYTDTGEKLTAAGRLYEQVEQDATTMAGSIGEGMARSPADACISSRARSWR